MNPKERAKRDDFRNSLKEWVEANCPDWTEEPAVVEWFAKAKTARNLENWRGQFWLFLGYVKMTPTQIMEKRRADTKSDDEKVQFFFEDLVIKFAQDLAAHHYGKNSVSSYLSRAQAFFASHRTPLKFAKGDLKIAETAAAKSEKRSKRFVKREAAAINMDIRLMYNVADPEDRVLLMFGYQYGFTPKDISMVRADELPVESEDDFVYWETTRSKTGEEVWTALNPEILHDIRALLKIRSVEVEGLRLRGKDDPGWLFITSRGNRLREDHISDRLKALAARALDAERAAGFAAKDLRDAFNVSLLESKLAPEVKDRLYGHKLEGSRGSYMMSPKSILEGYMKVFELVSLDGAKQARREYKERDDFLEFIAEFMTEKYPELIELLAMRKGLDPAYARSMLDEGRMTIKQMISLPSKRD